MDPAKRTAVWMTSIVGACGLCYLCTRSQAKDVAEGAAHIATTIALIWTTFGIMMQHKAIEDSKSTSDQIQTQLAELAKKTAKLAQIQQDQVTIEQERDIKPFLVLEPLNEKPNRFIRIKNIGRGVAFAVKCNDLTNRLVGGLMVPALAPNTDFPTDIHWEVLRPEGETKPSFEITWLDVLGRKWISRVEIHPSEGIPTQTLPTIVKDSSKPPMLSSSL